MRRIALNARAPAWSPDGSRLAYLSSVNVVDYDDSGSITIARLDGSGSVQVSAPNGPGRDVAPQWSPSGRELEYQEQRAPDGPFWIYVVRADGRQKRPLAAGHNATWSPDGRRLALVHDYRLITIGRDGQGRKRISPQSEYVVSAAWSPKGGVIAYVAGTKAPHQAYLPKNLHIETVGADGKHVHVLAPQPALFFPAEAPVWTADGKRILIATAAP